MGAETESTESAERPLNSDVVAALADSHRAFLGFLEKRVGRREVAEDLLQDAFARGLASLPALENAESAVAWFYRVLRNAVIDHHRRGGAGERALAALAREMEEHVDPALHTPKAGCRCVG